MIEMDDIEARKAMLAAIIDSSEDAIISKTLDGLITSWNNAAERVFGYTEAEVIGKHISLLIPTERLGEEDMIISNLKAGKRIDHFETIRVTKSGEKLNISLTVSPIKNANGFIIGASKIARDITKQKQAERTIAEYVQRMEIINSVGKTISAGLDENVILQKVTDATTLLSNAAFGAFFYNKKDSEGDTYMLYALSGAPREAFEKFGMPRNTKVFDMTFSGTGVLRSDDITKDPRYGHNSPHKGMPKGHLPVVSYLAVPVTSKSGVVIGGLFFGHPEVGVFKQEHEILVMAIASQAAVALDNAKLYEEVRSLSSKKDEFIGFASHELKTPLTTISGYLQLAQQEPSLSVSFIPKVQKQVNRLTAIISDLLDISKIQAGKVDLNFTTISLSVLIRENVETVKQIFPKYTIQTDLPIEDLIVKVDTQKIGQVLINILTNAVKYSPENTKISLKASVFGDKIRVSVQDYGIGIAPRELDVIFNRFFRSSQTATRTEGLGLGLYISREIIEQHHGRIWAESQEGKGSTFYIEFPITRRTPAN